MSPRRIHRYPRSQWGGSTRRIGFWVAVAIPLVLVGSVLFAWFRWDWLRGDQDSPGATIRNVGLLAGGLIAMLLAIWRSRVSERQADSAQRQAATAEQALLNERYQRASEMLGSDILPVRLGGIATLRHLAAIYAQLYHVQVIDLLCSFVRNPPGGKGEDAAGTALRLRDDVQAAITAIGTRSAMGIELERQAGFQLNLSGADFELVDLPEMNLANAMLRGAVLRRANLPQIDLSCACLDSANLDGAMLRDANLSGATLVSANMSFAFCQGADLSNTDLSGAKLTRTNLSRTELEGADLSQANIIATDLSEARLHNAYFSGARFDSMIVSLLTDEDEEVIVRVTQEQLDTARAVPGDPPQITGVLDYKTKDLLVWRDNS